MATAIDRVWITGVTQALDTVQDKIYAIGSPMDVGDWNELFVEVETVTSDAALDSDVEWYVQTAMTSGLLAQWDNCFTTGVDLSKVATTRVAARVSDQSSNPPRRWIRLVLKHCVTTAQTVKINAIVLLKR